MSKDSINQADKQINTCEDLFGPAPAESSDRGPYDDLTGPGYCIQIGTTGPDGTYRKGYLTVNHPQSCNNIPVLVLVDQTDYTVREVYGTAEWPWPLQLVQTPNEDERAWLLQTAFRRDLPDHLTYQLAESDWLVLTDPDAAAARDMHP